MSGIQIILTAIYVYASIPSSTVGQQKSGPKPCIYKALATFFFFAKNVVWNVQVEIFFIFLFKSFGWYYFLSNPRSIIAFNAVRTWELLYVDIQHTSSKLSINNPICAIGFGLCSLLTPYFLKLLVTSLVTASTQSSSFDFVSK